MYKILIVDDEAIEAQALERIVQERYAEACKAWTAPNGKAAITLAETMRVDIVLMDIEMPGMNGLEAARIIKETLPWCRIIIITAYQRFQYAQLAISLGAEDYLLKPVANADLYRLLDKAMRDLDSDREDAAKRKSLNQLAKEQFVLAAISGQAHAESLKAQLDALEIPFRYGLVCKVKSLRADSAERIETLLDPLISAEVGIQTLTYPYDDVLYMVVLMYPNYINESAMQQMLGGMVLTIKAESGMQLLIGMGRSVVSLESLQISFDQATEALACSREESPVMLPPGSYMADRHRGLERRLYGYLLEKDLDAAIRCVDTMFDTMFYCLEQPAAVSAAARKLLSRVALKLQKDARSATDFGKETELLEKEPLSQQEMLVRIRGLLMEWIQALEVQPAARLQRIRADIERYLQQHYAEDLSIKEAAKAMHYSEPYFSKLFSRCFHRNFVSYLTDIRMQAAREMLGGTTASIREVSVAVGFADANYFAKVFRKAFGISPSEYRRLSFAAEEHAES